MTGALQLSAAVQWLGLLGYPQPTPGHPVLLYLEGCRLAALRGAGGHVWKGADPAHRADLWEVDGDNTLLMVEVVPNAINTFNDVGVLVWLNEGQRHLAAFTGSVNAAPRLSRKDGWPQIGDGTHAYARSTYKNGQKPCLRTSRNRCLREVPPRAGVGGDGHLTLSEVIERGMDGNGSILVHPGAEPWYSAGCLLVPGTANDPTWRAVSGLATAGCTVIVHEGADVVAWLADGRPVRPPVVRPGCDAARWVKPLQQKLQITADGVFGEGTARALRARREALGVTGDALDDVGVRSWDWASLGISVPVAG